MQMCEWGATKDGFRPSSHFTLHEDNCSQRQIQVWFEQAGLITSSYSMITYLCVPEEFLPREFKGDVLMAILKGENGIIIDSTAGEHIIEAYE